MRMSMVNIREMRVFVCYGDMSMPMVMRLVAVPVEIVRVLMMFVMNMAMTVFHRLVHVFVFMMLRQV